MRDALGALLLVLELVDVAVDALEAPEEKVRVAELPGPLEERPPLGAVLRLVAAAGEGRRDVAAR
jgi:hypothetical protein